jgi:hypothetical protein
VGVERRVTRSLNAMTVRSSAISLGRFSTRRWNKRSAGAGPKTDPGSNGPHIQKSSPGNGEVLLGWNWTDQY